MRRKLLTLTLCSLILISSLFISTSTSSAISKEYVSDITKETNIEYVYNERSIEDKIKMYVSKYQENFMKIIFYTVHFK